ncbi:hypothetical protein Tco_1076187 [Tanacetum coccineum]
MGYVPTTVRESPTTDNSVMIRSGPTSYAKLVIGEPSRKSVNFFTLIALGGNKDDVAIPLESIRGTPLMLDSYKSDMCMQSWGRSIHARAMIEPRAHEELKNTIVVAMTKLVGDGFNMCTIRVKYE